MDIIPLPLVKYECGCIGFPPVESGEALIIDHCDAGVGENLCFANKPGMNQKTWLDLSEEEAVELTESIRQLVFRGHKWNNLKSLLRD